MVKVGDYTIEEYSRQNKIVITLPQTFLTATSTALPFGDRKDKLTDDELAAIVNFVSLVYSGAFRKEK